MLINLAVRKGGLPPLFLFAFFLVTLTPTQTTNAKGHHTAYPIESTLHISPLKPSDDRYAYFEFQVPSGCTQMKVSYDYDRTKNTVDLGLFDSTSSSEAGNLKGFRGWSGGRRSEVTVARAEATPGYLAGDIPTGAWRLIFGLYKICPDGADIKIRITTATATTDPATASFIASPVDATASIRFRSAAVPKGPSTTPRQWFRGDLHCHTVHSDGDWTVEELAKTANAMNLDFLVVTDHNTMSHHRDIDNWMHQNPTP